MLIVNNTSVDGRVFKIDIHFQIQLDGYWVMTNKDNKQWYMPKNPESVVQL